MSSYLCVSRWEQDDAHEKSSDEWRVDLNSVKIHGEEAKARESHLSGAYPE